MASSPQFAGTVLMGSAAVSASADTSYTAPTHAVSIVAAGASGSKIDEVVLQAIGTTVASVINLFVYDGAAYHLFDAFLVPVVSANTTTQPAWRLSKTYSNLVLASGWTLYATSMAANQLVNVLAFGGSF